MGTWQRMAIKSSTKTYFATRDYFIDNDSKLSYMVQFDLNANTEEMCRHSSVGRAFVCGTIDPSFVPHQCLLTGMWKKLAWLPCWLPRGWQVLHQRRILGNIQHILLCQAQIRLSTLVLKPRGDITRCPKQGYQWPWKKDLGPPKINLKKYMRF